MLAISLADHPARVGEASPLILREKLKCATADAHRRLDVRICAYELTSVSGYRRFLEASAAALLPLETALEHAGIGELFPDWPQRTRRRAIADDLDQIGGVAHPMPPLAPLGRNEVLGAMYVLEGSRLGARYLLRTIAGCGEPLIAVATNYLRHGSSLPLWQTFLAKLESEPVTPYDEAEVISGAHRAFARFANAAEVGA